MARSCWIAGVRFVSGGDGHYYSDCGTFAVFHAMRGTVEDCWELYRLRSGEPCGDPIDAGTTLSSLVSRGYRRVFSLKLSAKERAAWYVEHWSVETIAEALVALEDAYAARPTKHFAKRSQERVRQKGSRIGPEPGR